MFLHIGSEIMVSADDIISIYDMEIFSEGDNQNFLKELQAERKITVVDKKVKAKSLVLTNDKAYLSPISATTLKNRSDSPYEGNLLIAK